MKKNNIMIKKYVKFINEAIIPDYNYKEDSMDYYVNMLENIIEDVFENLRVDENENNFNISILPKVFQMILTEYFEPEEYDSNGRWILPENRAWTFDYTKEKMEQFVGAFLMDDGENRLDNGTLKRANNDNSNISHSGTCLWVLEQLGYKIPCVIEYNYRVISETKSFNEAILEFDKMAENNAEIKENRNNRIDRAGRLGRFSMSIVGIMPE